MSNDEAMSHRGPGADDVPNLTAIEGGGQPDVGKADVTIFNIEHGASNVAAIEDDEKIFGKHASLVLAPPLPPRALARRYDESYALRPNIDAYVTNIEGFGHRLEPRIDLKSQDADERLTDAILMEHLYTKRDSKDIGVTPELLAAKRRELEVAARVERLKLEMFFQNPTIGESFTQFRRRMRRDLEVTGNAYIEVVRNPDTNMVAQLTLAPSVNMRLTRQGRAVKSKQKRRISPIMYQRVEMRRRFRRFIQTIEGSNEVVFFKEVGDPRVMSATTGKYYPTISAMKKKESTRSFPATEMIHLKLDDPQSAYGTPRWQGGIMAVIGGRAAEEVNAAYFDEKTIPPGFLMVSGAPLKKGADKKIEQYLKDHIKGRRNFWSIVVIEAEAKASAPGAAPPRARIEWVPMTEQQQQDALFQNYDERNGEKIGNMFRLPKILRGDMRDFNRSTAKEALQYAEQQVFEPERTLFDEMINDVLFVHMDVKYWKFVSNSPVTRDPKQLADILTTEAARSALTIGEMRTIFGADILNTELAKRDDAWTDVPMKVFELTQKGAGGSNETPEPQSIVDRLTSMREELESAKVTGEPTSDEGDDTGAGDDDMTKALHALEKFPKQVETIAIPPAEFENLFG